MVEAPLNHGPLGRTPGFGRRSGTDRRVHKVVHHFLLEALHGELTIENDPDREAEKVEWVRLDRVSSRLAYPNERRIVALAREILRGE